MNNLDSGLKNPFRWYANKRFQNIEQSISKHSLDAFKLISTNDRFLPFQLIKEETTPFLFTELTIFDVDNSTSTVLDFNGIQGLFEEDDFAVYTFEDGTEYIVYYGNRPFKDGFTLPEGKYYLEAKSVDNVWTSEIFTVYENLVNTIKKTSFLPHSSINDEYSDDIRKYKAVGRMDFGASGFIRLQCVGGVFWDFRDITQSPSIGFEDNYDFISYETFPETSPGLNDDSIVFEVAHYQVESLRYYYDGYNNTVYDDFPITFLGQRKDPDFWYQADGQSQALTNILNATIEINDIVRARTEYDKTIYRSYTNYVEIDGSAGFNSNNLSSFPTFILSGNNGNYSNQELFFSETNGELLKIRKIAIIKPDGKDKSNCFIMIEYCNCAPLGRILYGNEFEYKNRFWLDMELGFPSYKNEEEGFEDEQKNFHATFQSQKKIYSLDLVLPEFMVDAVNLLTLHDVIFLKMPHKEDARIRDVKVTTSFKGAFAECTIEFREETIIGSASCGIDYVKTYAEKYAISIVCSMILNDVEYSLYGYFSNNVFNPFVPGDQILIFDDATQTSGGVYSYGEGQGQGGPTQGYGFESFFQVEQTLVYLMREEKYWFYVDIPFSIWTDRPVIKQHTSNAIGHTIKGLTFPNSYSELYRANVVYNPNPTPLNFVKMQKDPILKGEFENIGFKDNTPIFFLYKVASRNHTNDFGLSEYS